MAKQTINDIARENLSSALTELKHNFSIAQMCARLKITQTQINNYIDTSTCPTPEVFVRVITNLLNDPEMLKCIDGTDSTIAFLRSDLKELEIKIPESVSKPTIDDAARDNLAAALDELRGHYSDEHLAESLQLSQVQIRKYVMLETRPSQDVFVRTVMNMMDDKKIWVCISNSKYLHAHVKSMCKDHLDEEDHKQTSTTTPSIVKQQMRYKNIRYAGYHLTSGLDRLHTISGWMELIGENHPTISILVDMGLLPQEKIVGIDTDEGIVLDLIEAYPGVQALCGSLLHYFSMIPYGTQVFNIDTCKNLTKDGEMYLILKKFSEMIPKLVEVQGQVVVFVTASLTATIEACRRPGKKDVDPNILADHLNELFPTAQHVELEYYKNHDHTHNMLQCRMMFTAYNPTEVANSIS